MLSKIIPKYDYQYFDRYSQLQTKQLNIFQCIFRKVFGCYAETHLLNVAERAYSITLNDQFHQSNTKREQLLQLIGKAEKIYFKEFNLGYHSVLKYDLPSGKTTHVGLRYNVTDTNRISSIDFDIQELQLRFYIFKNSQQKMIVSLPNFAALATDSKLNIKSRLVNEETQLATSLLQKIMCDTTSAECETLADLHFYARDYRWLSRMRYNHLALPSPETQNKAQHKALNSLGWEYLKQHVEGESAVTNVQRVYLLRKENERNNLAATRTISLAFAIQSLEPQNRIY